MKINRRAIIEFLFGGISYFAPTQIVKHAFGEEALNAWADEPIEIWNYGFNAPILIYRNLLSKPPYYMFRKIRKREPTEKESYGIELACGLFGVGGHKLVQAVLRPYFPELIEPEDITGKYVYTSLLYFIRSETIRDLIRAGVIGPFALYAYRKIRKRLSHLNKPNHMTNPNTIANEIKRENITKMPETSGIPGNVINDVE